MVMYHGVMNNLYKATFRIFTPHAGDAAYGVGFSKSPKEAISIAKSNAWDGLDRWDNENSHISSIGGDYLYLQKGAKFIHEKLDL